MHQCVRLSARGRVCKGCKAACDQLPTCKEVKVERDDDSLRDCRLRRCYRAMCEAARGMREPMGCEHE